MIFSYYQYDESRYIHLYLIRFMNNLDSWTRFMKMSLSFDMWCLVLIVYGFGLVIVFWAGSLFFLVSSIIFLSLKFHYWDKMLTKLLAELGQMICLIKKKKGRLIETWGVDLSQTRLEGEFCCFERYW